MDLQTRKEISGKFKTGLMSGLIGGVVVVSSFMTIDSDLGLANGSFFEMMGIAIGLGSSSGITFGVIATFVTSAIIGIIYGVLSSFWRATQIVSVPKGIITGTLTGIIVFAIFFSPIHYFLIMPTIENMLQVDSSSLDPELEHNLTVFLEKSEAIIWGALLLHVIFGSVMGLFCGFILHEEYSPIKKLKKIF